MHTLTSWGGEMAVGTDHNTGLIVTKLLTRPKTSSSLHRASVQYACGAKRAMQVLGEKLTQPTTPPQLPSQERPKTSVIRSREKERPATSVREHSGFVVVPGKELSLPICTTRNIRSPGTDKEILSITTTLRNRSAAGARGIVSLIGPTARDRSAALLKELSLSLSLSQKDGPASPFKDCLRERWRSMNKDDPLLTSTATELPLSPVMPLPSPDIGEEAKSVLSTDDCLRSSGKSSERPKKTSTLIDFSETLMIRSSSPTKDCGELTRRSLSPVKDRRSRNPQKSSLKRVRSSRNVLTYFNANWSDNKDVPGNDVVLRSEKDVVMKSLGIITINRLPSPKSTKELKTKSQEKTDSRTKPLPKSILPARGASCEQHGDNLPSIHSAHSSKETLAEGLPQREAPCQVTSFEMAITPVKVSLHSPRIRAASFISDIGHPVSVSDDTVLRMCSLTDPHPSPFFHSETEDTGFKLTQEATGSGTLVKNCRQSETNEVSHEDGKTLYRGDAELPESKRGTFIKDNSGTVYQDNAFPKQTVSVTLFQQSTDPEADMNDKRDQCYLREAETARDGQLVSETIFISPRNADVTGVNGEVVKVVSANSVDPHSIHVPVCSDSCSSVSSSSTPTVPLSSSDLLYSNGGEGPGARTQTGGHGHGCSEETGDVGSWEHRSHDKQKLKELDLHGNKRPPSRSNSNNRKVPNFDKVPFDRDREELRPFGPAKPSPHRANGVKNNLFRADQFLSQRNNGREEDLVAMGTIWNPSNLQTRGSSTGTTSSGKSTSATITSGAGPYALSSGNGGSGGGAGGATVSGRRPVNLNTTTSTRQQLHHQSGGSGAGGGASFGGGGGAGASGARAAKEVEPKYSDPLVGATPTFQQRLMELAAMEAETVRWEKTKKIKKKTKQDRDS